MNSTDIDTLFFELLDASPQDRESRLGDLPAPVAVKLRKMLELDSSGADRLQGADPALIADSLSKTRPVQEPGSNLGQYKIISMLGEGGMGTVYLAEQGKPVRMQVALKVIRPELAGSHMMARFDAERQALAMMDHPNIARVLNAGVGENGEPFFAMELVADGQNLTTYCDNRHLSIERRLRLFVAVCHGVQHAHQKGVVHRDLKPGNIIVTEHNGEAVPKIIDFGLAKALQKETHLTDESIVTSIGQVLGTLRYMSPEQAGLKGQDIDTRTDVYSLGVILYELLTGATPLTPEMLNDSGLEALQTVREAEIPRPSLRLSAPDFDASVIQSRSTNMGSLKRALAGDLDWIVLKALEKDRNRRYDTINSLATDVTRYLNNEPVDARPPSRSYRLKKYARKHQVMVTTLSAVFLTIIAGAVISTLFAIEASRQKTSAIKNADIANTAKDVAQRKSRAAEIAQAQAEAAAKEARTQSELALSVLSSVAFDVQRELTDFSGSDQLRRKLLMAILSKIKNVSALYSNGTQSDEILIAAMTDLGDMALNGLVDADSNAGNEEESGTPLALAETFFRQAHAVATKHEDTSSPRLARASWVTFNKLAKIESLKGNNEEALRLQQNALTVVESLAARSDELGGFESEIATSHGFLAETLKEMGRVNDATQQYEQALKLQRQIAESGANEDSDTALIMTLLGLGEMDRAVGDLESAMTHFNEAQELAETYGHSPTEHRSLVYYFWLANRRLGELHHQQGDNQLALQHQLRSLAAMRSLLDADPTHLGTKQNVAISGGILSGLYTVLGDQNAAIDSAFEAATLFEELSAGDEQNESLKQELNAAWLDLGAAYFSAGRQDEALNAYEKSNSSSSIGMFHHRAGSFAVAETYFVEAAKTAEELADIDPTAIVPQRNLAVARANVASARLKQGKVSQAVAAFESGNSIFAKLAERQPTSYDAHSDLYVSHMQIGDAWMEAREYEKSQEHYEKAADVLRQLLRSHQSDLRARLDLAKLIAKLGKVEKVRENYPAAMLHYTKSSSLASSVCEEFPADPEAVEFFALAELSVGRLFYRTLEWDRAKKRFEAAKSALTTLHDVGRRTGESHEVLDIIIENLEYSKLAGVAFGDWDALLAEPQNRLPALLNHRITHFAEKGEVSTALEAATKLKELGYESSDSEPEYSVTQGDIAKTILYLAENNSQSGKPSVTLELCMDLVELRRALVQQAPESDGKRTAAVRDLCQSLTFLGTSRYRAGAKNVVAPLEEAERLLDKLTEANPYDDSLAAEFAESCRFIGDFYFNQGATREARGHYKRMDQICEGLHRKDPSNVQFQSLRSIALERMGDVNATESEFDKAAEYYAQKRTLDRAIVSREPSNTEAKRNLGFALLKCGRMYLYGETPADAMEDFEECVSVRKELAKADPDSWLAAEQLRIAYRHLATWYLSHGSAGDAHVEVKLWLNEAIRFWQLNPESPTGIQEILTALERYTTFLGANPDQCESKVLQPFIAQLCELGKEEGKQSRELRLRVLRTVGECAEADDDVAPHVAIELLTGFQTLNDRFGRSYFELAAHRENRSSVFRRLTTAYLRMGDVTAAEACCLENLELAETAFSNNNTDVATVRQKRFAHSELARYYLVTSQLQKSITHYENALKLAEKMRQYEESSGAELRIVQDVLFNLTEVYAQSLKQSVARTYHAKCRDLGNQFGPDEASNQIPPEQLDAQKKRIAAIVAACRDNTGTETQTPETLYLRGFIFAQNHKIAEASDAAARLLSLTPSSHENLYSAACIHALIVGPERNESQQSARGDRLKLAIDTLGRAIDAGWNDIDHIRNDTDLVWLRMTSDFQELLATEEE